MVVARHEFERDTLLDYQIYYEIKLEVTVKSLVY